MTRVLLFLVGLDLATSSCATATATPASPASPAALAPTTTPESGPGGRPVARAEPILRADPCVDFDEFANGGWRAANPRPPNEPRWSRRAEAREANRRDLEALLEELSRKADWPRGSAEQVLSDHHAACMDEAAIEAAGRAPVDPWLAEIDGARTSRDLQRLIRRLHELGIAAPFGTAGAVDYQDPSRFVASVVAGELGLPDRDSYLQSQPRFVERRERYQARVASVLVAGGMAEAEARSAAVAILALERRLAEASLGAAQAADPAATAHRMTFAQLQALAPHVDWATYFDEARWPRGELNVAEPKLLQQVDRELVTTPVPVWKAYLRWRLLDAAAPALSRSFAEPAFEFKERYLGGAGEQKPRARRCVESAEALFGEALGRKYVERHFSAAAKARSQRLVQTLLGVMKGEVAKFGWMSPETREKALAKLATFNAQMGYPDTWLDLTSISVGRRTFWANVVVGRKLKVDENRRQVGQPTDRSSWLLPASSPDAYIDPQLHELVVPAGFLQRPAFDPDATDAVNFGAIGVGLAHDLFHSIDTLGAEYDPLGRPRGWWLDADRERFEERARCVSQQFEGYFIEPGVHHQGKLVLREAVADLVGARVAFLAMREATGDRPSPAIDGLSGEQQFFVALAHFRGDEMSLEAQRALVKEDLHPVAKYRIIGTLSNLPEFQEAFACQAGAPMVRAPRCSPW
jgi:putative endopeptidase